MFSKSKSKGDKAKKRTSNPETRPIGNLNLTQFGLLDVPNVSDFALKQDGDEDDSALEAELLALTGGGSDKQHNKKAKKLVASGVLDQMVAECMKDYTDEELSDIDDQELLAELNELGSEDENDDATKSQHDTGSHTHSDISPTDTESSGIESVKPAKLVPTIIKPSPFLAGSSIQSLLTERIEMYEEAIQNAVDSGEDSRAKRFKRGLATLNQMMKSVKNGKAINEEDIPPAILVKTSRANSSVDVSEFKRDNEKQLNKNLATDLVNNGLEKKSSSTTIPQNIVFGPKDEEHPTSSSDPSVLLRRQLEYKVAAVNAKKAGDLETALHYLKIVKHLSSMIDAARNGQEIDVHSIPSTPGTTTSCQGATTGNTVTARQVNIPVANRSTQNEVLVQHDDEEKTSASSPVAIGDSNQTTSVPSIPAPISILDALEQRLQKYAQQRDKAKAEEDSRKERMNTRIMKQYQDAIKGYKAGKVVNFDELPTPPGYPPIPTGAPLPPISLLSPGAVPAVSSSVSSSSLPSEKAPTPQPIKNDSPLVPKSHRPAPPIPGSVNSSDIKTNVRKAPQSRVERQLSLLQKRQDQFKEAALEAKKRGEIEQAKEYLRNFKGFDQLIMVTNSGLPVDMNTVPVPPQEQISSFNASIDFEIIDKNDCEIPPPTTPADLAIAFSKLENDLIAQIKMCAQTREHFKAVGDVASSNRFENLIVHTKKDLDAVRVAMKRGDNPPKFHYENRSFTIIQCNTDLNDSDCEVTIMSGINYNVPNPKEIDTYVKLEFPYPSENPPQGKTELVKNSNCPVYEHKALFSIDRKARALSRVFKRHSVKCQVVARGGFFHRDSVIGTAKVPLADLETKCTLHDSFDILDERKKMVGGKLEVKIRVRNPIISKQLEKVNEKWIVIDGF